MINFFLDELKIIDKDTTLKRYTHSVTGATAIFVSNKEPNSNFCCGIKNIYKSDRGLAHCVEHLVFSGSKKYPDYDDTFSYLADTVSYTYLNAITYKDFTTYLCSSLDNVDFEKMVDVYLDAIFAPIFKEGKFNQEIYLVGGSGAVYNEINEMYKDDMYFFENQCNKEIFDDFRKFNPHGDSSEIKKVTREDILEYYNRVYIPKNMIFFFKFNSEKVSEEIFLNKLDDYLEGFDSSNFSEEFEMKKVKNYYAFQDEKNRVEVRRVAYKNVFDKLELKTICEFVLENAKSDFLIKDYSVYSTYNNIIVYALTDRLDIDIFDELLSYCEELFQKKDLLRKYINKKQFFYKNKDFGYKPNGIYMGIQYIENFFNIREVNLIDYNFVYDLVKKKNNLTDFVYSEYLEKSFVSGKVVANVLNSGSLIDESDNIEQSRVSKKFIYNVERENSFKNNFDFKVEENMIICIYLKKYNYENFNSLKDIQFKLLYLEWMLNKERSMDFVSFSCNLFWDKNSFYIEYVLLSNEDFIEVNLSVFDNIGKNIRNLSSFYEYYKEKSNEHKFLKNYLGEEKNVQSNYLREFGEDKCLINCKVGCKNYVYNSFDFIIRKIESIPMPNISDFKIKLSSKNKCYTLMYEFDVKYLLLNSIIYSEYILKELRFGPKAYCYNVVFDYDCFFDYLKINYIVEAGDMNKSDLVMENVFDFAQNYEITKEVFDFHKEKLIKSYDKIKPKYVRIQQSAREKYSHRSSEYIIGKLINLKYEDFSVKIVVDGLLTM